MADEEKPLKGGDGPTEDGDGDAPRVKEKTCGDYCEACIIGSGRVRSPTHRTGLHGGLQLHHGQHPRVLLLLVLPLQGVLPPADGRARQGDQPVDGSQFYVGFLL